MPKNNTGNKRASSASTKKNGLKKRFDLTNKKVQFFVVIAIVAVLGGGWFTYRSFAAVMNTYTWAPKGTQVNIVAKGNCKVNVTNDAVQNGTSKSTLPVWSVACPQSTGSFTQIYPDYVRVPAGTYRTCATLKGAGKVTLYTNGSSFGGSIAITPNADTYKEYCSATHVLPADGYSAAPNITLDGQVSNVWVNITQLQLQRVTEATAPVAK